MFRTHPISEPVYARASVSKYVYMHTKKGKVFFYFNDALNTFYLRLYDVIHMVTDHSDILR